MVPQGKLVVCINNATVTNAGTVTGRIDTLGFDYLTLDVFSTTSNDATNDPTVFKITEGDTTTAATAITALEGDNASGWTIPNMETTTNTIWGVKFNIDLRGRKRYLKLWVSPLTSHTMSAVANLYRGEESPTTTTKAGVAALVEV